MILGNLKKIKLGLIYPGKLHVIIPLFEYEFFILRLSHDQHIFSLLFSHVIVVMERKGRFPACNNFNK